MRPEEIKKGLGFDDIGLLPTDKSLVLSRKNLTTKTRFSRNVELDYPLIASPMDTVTGVEMCLVLNSIGAAGVLHRFMPIKDQVEQAHIIKKETKRCYVAVGLQDYQDRVPLLFPHADVIYLDTANGSNVAVTYFMHWYYRLYGKQENKPDVVIGNTLTKASVSRAINLGCDGVRHGIGGGSACLTSQVTGIECPPVTALYYGWKALRNHELEQIDLGKETLRPTLLLDGGIRKSADLVKALVCGADAVICGHIFAGCEEAPGKVVGSKKEYRGMASRATQEAYGLLDDDPQNIFIEGAELEVPYTGKSAKDIVYEFANGLRSAMSYLGFENVEEMRGSLWDERCIGVRL